MGCDERVPYEPRSWHVRELRVEICGNGVESGVVLFRWFGAGHRVEGKKSTASWPDEMSPQSRRDACCKGEGATIFRLVWKSSLYCHDNSVPESSREFIPLTAQRISGFWLAFTPV